LISGRVLAHKNSHFSPFRDSFKSVPKTLVFETPNYVYHLSDTQATVNYHMHNLNYAEAATNYLAHLSVPEASTFESAKLLSFKNDKLFVTLKCDRSKHDVKSIHQLMYCSH
jgi:hypothetical protein